MLTSIDQKAVRVPFAVAAKALDATADDLTVAMFFDELKYNIDPKKSNQLRPKSLSVIRSKAVVCYIDCVMFR